MTFWKKRKSFKVAQAMDLDKAAVEEVKKVSIRQLYRYASSLDLALICIALSLAVVTGLGLPFLSVITGQVMQDFINATVELQYAMTPEQHDAAMDLFSHSIIKGCVQYSIVGFCILVAASIQVSFLLYACEQMTDRLRRDFVKAVIRQNIGWFDRNQSGTLSSKLFDNLERVREGTGDKMGLLVQFTSQFLGGFGVAFSYSWLLTLIMMTLMPFMALCGVFIGKLLANATAEEAKKYAKAGGIAEEVLSSIRTVHAFNAQHYEVARYEQALEDGKRDGIKKSLLVGLGLGFTFMVVFASFCLAFWVGTDYVADAKMDAGTVLTVFFAIMLGSLALGQAAPQFGVVSAALGAASPLHEIIDRVPEIDAYSEEGLIPTETKGNIRFENVRFTYPNRPEAEILKGISFDCQPGQTIAFVGSSGCGKSTSISLLLRYYNPTSGEIYLDGTPLRNYNIGYLRKTLGVVSQEPILFDTTIEENIRFGRDDVTKEEMNEALRKANAYDFVMDLPEGVKTMVGTRGTQLSGGQKQRIAIARALVRNPRILLLDEATSALDAQSERVVQEALENASKGRTTFVVAHRLSTIQDADCILVFKDGVIVEKGRHAELLDLKGHYHALVHAQVFADVEKEEEEENNRRTSLAARKDQCGEGEELGEEQEVGIEMKDELKRLKRELAEEGVERVGLVGMLREARPEWVFIALGFISAAIQGCVFPSFSLFFTDMINVFTLTDLDKMRNQGHFYASLFLLLGVVNGVTMLGMCFFFGLTSERFTMRLRLKVFRNLLSMQIAFMDEPKHSPGKLCTRLATDAPMVKSALDNRLGQVMAAFVSVSCGIGIAFYYGWQMALLVIGIFPLSGLGQAIQLKYMKSRNDSDNTNLETAGKIATEAMENVRTVQALTLERNVLARFCSYLDAPLRRATKRGVIQGLSYGFATSIFYFLYAAAFRFGLYLIENNLIDPMNVLNVLFAIAFTAGSAGLAAAYFPEYMRATFAAGLIWKMLAMRTEIDSTSEEGLKGSAITGDISLRAVQFHYEQRPSVKILSGLDLDIQSGQTVALVGPSGCGKSTVVSLIERFYDPTAGRVIVDGVELTERNLRDVRSQMAIVSQEPILFDMSIRENISYGVEADEDAIIKAAMMANAHNFITAMPAGYDTRVGEKGTQLSGGQKQRVAIARALVRNPKVLLLDEATSALDMESERVVQEALDSASQGRTCIMIAHRLATVVNAHKIVVVNEGKIVEQGNHEELMHAQGAYYRMVTKQLKK